MALEQISIHGHGLNFYVESNPDNSGIRLMQKVGEQNIWIMTIIDNGSCFSIANFDMSGQLNLCNFKSENRLFNKDGTMPPLEVDNQIEVNTPYGNKILVRDLDHNNPNTGVIIAYSDGVCLYSIALCEINAGGFRVVLSK